MTRHLVIIGAGMGTARLIDRLTADDGPPWRITLFNAEPCGSYNRILLSPVLAGEKTFDRIVTHDAAFYAAHAITTRFGERVTAIDPAARTVTGEDGVPLPWDRLVIAMGSTPFVPPLPGRDLDGVIAWRDRADTERMMALAPGQRAVVIGGGVLGLEAAAGMRARGVDVTIVHMHGHLMERQLDETAGKLLRAELVRRGIKVLVSTGSTRIEGAEGRVTGLTLDTGTTLPCDLLVTATGIRPKTALAQAAGLDVARGITVDDRMVTSDPAILAIGECTEHRGQLFGLVAPIRDQADVAAETLAGRPAAFAPQEVAMRLKVTGCDLFSAGDFAPGEGREEITRRDPARASWRRLVLEGDRLVGAVIYGDTADGPWFHGLIRDRVPVAALRDRLIFGPGRERAPAPDPTAAVAASPADCNGGTAGRSTRHGRGCARKPLKARECARKPTELRDRARKPTEARVRARKPSDARVRARASAGRPAARAATRSRRAA